jgi:hypothetical protein
MIVVSHKGVLTNGSQWYSLVASEPMTTQAPARQVPSLTFWIQLILAGLTVATGSLLLRRYCLS